MSEITQQMRTLEELDAEIARLQEKRKLAQARKLLMSVSRTDAVELTLDKGGSFVYVTIGKESGRIEDDECSALRNRILDILKEACK